MTPQFSVAFSRVLLIFLITACSTSIDKEAWRSVEGYWEGTFMPESGLDLVLVLHFYVNEDQETNARVLLWQEGIQIQDDPLSKIVVKEDKLSFYIKPKDTPFKGSINVTDQYIKGHFTFPDGLVHPATVRKVTLPSLDPRAVSGTGDYLIQAYNKSQLLEDFNFLQQKLESLHPALYRHTSKDSLDLAFMKAGDLLHASLTEEEFLRLLGPPIARIRCAHTAIRPSNAYESAITPDNHFLPLVAKIVDNRLYSIHLLVDTLSIEPGSEILSINGVVVSELLRSMMSNLSADGYNKTYKLFQLNHNFSVAYAMWISRSHHYEVILRSPGQKVTQLTLPATSYSAVVDGYRLREPDYNSDKQPVNIEYLRDLKTAILTICNVGGPDPERFITFIADVFRELRRSGIEYLVLDLRGNTGGPPLLASELFSYLADSSYTYFKRPNDGLVEFPELYEPAPPKADRFRGTVFMLMDGGSLSSTGHFLSMIKYHRLATLIGQESGGTYYCNNASVQLKLPITGIRVNIPQRTYQTTAVGLDRRHGILPDHLVIKQVRDLIDGSDPVLNFTLRLIRNRVSMPQTGKP